ncbi:hypothetical protein [Ureibacillus chungkukjangi]|uniref:Uncharacterized protein n=1 Tax=Ureibacillus chungkukjangi TaxID=1202712 RepID=A0A318TWK6_9BACL|nr:hypothetical protein [Ureibacillus chungkukjangi]MCM3389553.1 hypothetical protein [Ureibacillus chungkukjangi]PYF04019.1 hypothetical protein BJ095_12649 [Ureibacillus chungkukjangi]
MQLGIWISIVISAIISFGIAKLFEQPLHWYLFVLIVFIGFFINTVMIILRTKEEQEKNET